MAVKVLAAVLAAVMLIATFNVQAADPELLTDFIMRDGLEINAMLFTSDALQKAMQNNSSPFATVTPAQLNQFPGLEGLGVSASLLQYPPGTVNRPHTHPRGTELLFVLDGTLDVGLLDSNNTLFTQTIYPRQLFVFPRGLVHFQINNGKDGKSATALGAFSSANPGTIILPLNLFGSKGPISIDVLSKSFRVSPQVIQILLDAN